MQERLGTVPPQGAAQLSFVVSLKCCGEVLPSTQGVGRVEAGLFSEETQLDAALVPCPEDATQ